MIELSQHRYLAVVYSAEVEGAAAATAVAPLHRWSGAGVGWLLQHNWAAQVGCASGQQTRKRPQYLQTTPPQVVWFEQQCQKHCGTVVIGADVEEWPLYVDENHHHMAVGIVVLATQP